MLQPLQDLIIDVGGLCFRCLMLALFKALIYLATRQKVKLKNKTQTIIFGSTSPTQQQFLADDSLERRIVNDDISFKK